jgi:aspartate/methionine/tyrosine aminotransferase
VICTFPGYESLYAIAEALGCEVTKWIPEEENNWRFDPHFLEKNIRSNTKLIIVNFPHNPTGYLPPKNDYELIIDMARKHNIHLFSDEMYRFLEYDGNERLPSACEIYEKAVSLFGMSKTFGMAGVRIGWLVTKDKNLFTNMAAFKDYTTICSSAPSEILSIIALRSRQKIIDRHISRIKRNLALLDTFFDNHQDRFEWVKPKAGTIGFPRLKGEINSLEFCQSAIRTSNIMLLPSTIYEFDDRHFRIGFGRENMPEALAKLSEFVSSLKNQGL